ncbi:hypothetical protein L218DRAFT_163690 [Marasmius fiardii PR-910]|nr:hypothetical protein L218DRAFT_163690 [Marasmius fiardii PR-910]
MGRWTQYDEDDYRLPPGMKRIGYDADTGEYFFSGGYKSAPYSTYGPLVPLGTSSNTLGFSEGPSPRPEASTLRLQSTSAVQDFWTRYRSRERGETVTLFPEDSDESEEDETFRSRESVDHHVDSKNHKTIALPIYAKFTRRSEILSPLSRTGPSPETRSAPSVVMVSRLTKDRRDGDQNRVEERDRSHQSESQSSLRILTDSTQDSSFQRESMSSSVNATVGTGSRIPSIITDSDLPPTPPAKDEDYHSSRVSSLSLSSDARDSWLTEGSLSSLPYLGNSLQS